MFTALGILLLIFATEAIVFRTAYARRDQHIALLFGNQSSLRFWKTHCVSIAVVIGLAGLCLVIGIIDLSGVEDRLIQKDDIALTSILTCLAIWRGMETLVRKQRWTALALTGKDRILGVILKERSYLNVAVMCATTNFAIGLQGIVRLMQLIS